MKLAVENHHLRELFGDEEAIRVAARAGFDGIDYSFYQLKEGDDLLNKADLADFAARIKKVCAENNISIVQAHAPFAFKYGEDYSADSYLDIVKALKVAGALGIPHIVVHLVKPTPAGVDYLEYNRGFYRSFIPYCEEYGVKIAVENLFLHDKVRECFFGRLGVPAEMTAFVKSLDSDCFIHCLDIGHTALTGVEPQDFIRAMSPDLLLGLHVQDNDYRGDRHWLPYCGKLNWGEITWALGEIGYRGDLTMEILHYIDKYPVDFLPQALAFAAQTGRYLISQIEAAR